MVGMFLFLGTSKYFLSEIGKLCDITNSNIGIVDTLEECNVACKALGMRFQLKTWDRQLPKGCYQQKWLNGDDSMSFNDHPIGGAWIQTAQLCKSIG